MQNGKCKIIAHRGASGLTEFDNSIESFRKAVDLGADMIELDVRRTKDREFVTYHDAEIEGQAISGLRYEELLDMTEERGFKVPTLEDVILISKGKIALDIELKEEGYEKKVVEMVRSYLDYDLFVMKSFFDSSVKKVKDFDDDIEAGLLVGLDDPSSKIKTRISELFPKRRLTRCRADFVAPNHRLLRFFYLKRMWRSGFDVFVWTVNEVELMKELMNKGVDALITDRPDLALEIRDEVSF